MIKDYREKMKKSLKAAGEYLADNAERLVDGLPERTHTVVFSVNFAPDTFPEVEISASCVPKVVVDAFMLNRDEGVK